MKDTLTDANFPKDSAGRVYHLGIKYGEVANRILTVGDPARARAIARWLDGYADGSDEMHESVFVKLSHRGFLTITGTYKGIPVTIMAIGMGNPMMDFFVRETRAVTRGPLAIIRFGSCGSLSPEAPCGSVIVPRGGYCIRKNLDYFVEPKTGHEQNGDIPYYISGTFPADANLTSTLVKHLTSALQPLQADRSLGIGSVLTGGLNADGCSFYASQGRQDPEFWDDNEHVIENALKKHPDTHSLEMETSMLFHLARCARNTAQPIYAAGCMQVFANRTNNDFIKPDVVQRLEPVVGEAVLRALIDVPLPQEQLMHGVECVWEPMRNSRRKSSGHASAGEGIGVDPIRNRESIGRVVPPPE